ncbi:MAG: hypothetical protein ABJE95_23655 [Byssovorax sp.]
MTTRWIGPGAIVAIATISSLARADGSTAESALRQALPTSGGTPLTFHAGSLEADPAHGVLVLREGVDVRIDRYRLTSDHLQIGVTPGAVLFGGTGRVVFCPCPDPPVALAFSGVRVETAGDLYVRSPRLELFHVPIFWLPYFWLRPPDEPGLHFPSIAIRGADGVLLGSGVHLPFREPDGAARAFDFSAAGYVKGGVELGARLTTPGSSASVIADHLHGDRVAIEGRGALASGGASLAWDVDAIRGDRARSGTIDLEPAARPFDHAAVEATLRPASGAVQGELTGGAVARAARGQGLFVAGPLARLAAGGSIGSAFVFRAGASGLVLGDAIADAARTIGRAAIAAEINARPGPFALRVDAGARAEIAAVGAAAPSRDATAGARIELDLPLRRDFARGDGEAPWQHRIAPSLAVAAAASTQLGSFFAPLALAAPPGLGLAAAGITTSFGRAAGPSLRFEARGGAALRGAGATPLITGRLTASAALVTTSLEVAAEPAAPAPGSALIGRARVGPIDGPTLALGLAAQAGRGAREARNLLDLRAFSAGGEIAYLAASGWTGSAEAMIPWLRVMRSGARADVDLGAGAILALRGVTEYRHACGCLALGASAAHRAGRDGVDVIFTVDLAPPL